jgi:hypothetical protein
MITTYLHTVDGRAIAHVSVSLPMPLAVMYQNEVFIWNAITNRYEQTVVPTVELVKGAK